MLGAECYTNKQKLACLKIGQTMPMFVQIVQTLCRGLNAAAPIGG